MKHKEITPVIKERFRMIDKHLRHAIIDLDAEAIHHFRTGVKKLRAFLRLLNVAQHEKDHLQLSKKIKAIYWYAGDLRNLQLHHKEIQDLFENNAALLPNDYIRSVKEQIGSLGRMLKTIVNTDDLNKEKNKILKNRPATPDKAAAKKFIYQKAAEFKHLLSQLNIDEMIHAVRKLLKDLLYNWKYIKAYKKLLPAAISGKKEIESLTVLLGDFCDKVAGIKMIEAYINLCLHLSEKEILQEIVARWKTDKEILRSQIYDRLHYNPA